MENAKIRHKLGVWVENLGGVDLRWVWE